MTLAKRLKSMGSAKYQNDGDARTSGPGFDVTLHPQTLDEPYRWRSPRVVFVNSMAAISVGESLEPQLISAVQRHRLCARRLSGTAQIGIAT
jgi:protein gp37